jgi:hypothetical protein
VQTSGATSSNFERIFHFFAAKCKFQISLDSDESDAWPSSGELVVMAQREQFASDDIILSRRMDILVLAAVSSQLPLLRNSVGHRAQSYCCFQRATPNSTGKTKEVESC